MALALFRSGQLCAEQSHFSGCQRRGDLFDSRLETEFTQYAGAVRRDLYARPKFVKLCRLFVERDSKTTLQQSQSSDEAADPGACDQDV
jgi:hypothetical protein